MMIVETFLTVIHVWLVFAPLTNGQNFHGPPGLKPLDIEEMVKQAMMKEKADNARAAAKASSQAPSGRNFPGASGSSPLGFDPQRAAKMLAQAIMKDQAAAKARSQAPSAQSPSGPGPRPYQGFNHQMTNPPQQPGFTHPQGQGPSGPGPRPNQGFNQQMTNPLRTNPPQSPGFTHPQGQGPGGPGPRPFQGFNHQMTNPSQQPGFTPRGPIHPGPPSMSQGFNPGNNPNAPGLIHTGPPGSMSPVFNPGPIHPRPPGSMSQGINPGNNHNAPGPTHPAFQGPNAPGINRQGMMNIPPAFAGTQPFNRPGVSVPFNSGFLGSIPPRMNQPTGFTGIPPYGPHNSPAAPPHRFTHRPHRLHPHNVPGWNIPGAFGPKPPGIIGQNGSSSSPQQISSSRFQLDDTMKQSTLNHEPMKPDSNDQPEIHHPFIPQQTSSAIPNQNSPPTPQPAIFATKSEQKESNFTSPSDIQKPLIPPQTNLTTNPDASSNEPNQPISPDQASSDNINIEPEKPDSSDSQQPNPDYASAKETVLTSLDSQEINPTSSTQQSSPPPDSNPQEENPASEEAQPVAAASESFSDVSKPSQPQDSTDDARDRTPKTTDKSNTKSSGDSSNGKRIICIFNNEHFYKISFKPSHMDPNLCTHINYEFAILDPTSYEIIISHPDIDIDFYKQAIGLKLSNPNLKVILGLGGWSDSTKKYSELAADPEKRKKFTVTTVAFLVEHGFDGLDVAWEYPNCWQGALGVSPKDKQNFVSLLVELKVEFDKNGLELSVSVGAIEREVVAAYDVPKISATVHFINVMTYDMHGPWEGKTGHHLQYEKMDSDEDPFCNVKEAMKVWVDKGADKEKLNMGLAFYARCYKLKNPNECGMGAPAEGLASPGPRTREAGKQDYNEMCENLNSGNWTEKEEKHAGFYAYSEDQWCAYDPPIMMVRKAKLVTRSGYGGVICKYISADDSEGRCFNMKFPLLKMVNMEMKHERRKFSRKNH